MKKVALVLFAVLLLTLVVACGKFDEPANGSFSANEPGQNQSEIVLEEPPVHTSFYFDSFGNASDALSNKYSFSHIKLTTEGTSYGDLWRKTLDAFEDKKIALPIPYLNGERIPLRNQAGFSNIVVMTSELYHMPWVWYYCIVGEDRLRISVSYPSVLGNQSVDSAKSFYEALQIIAPKAPSPDNYSEFSSYEKIYEKEITFGDGSHVKAMISECKDNTIYCAFYQNGMFIKLYADKDLFSDEFWSEFSIQ